MAYPTIPAWAFQDPVTSAKLQQDSDALTWLLFKAHGTYSQVTTAQSIANDTDVAVGWNSNVRQYKVTHSTSTNNDRVTPAEPGLYLVIAKVQFAADAGAVGYRKLWVEQNGSASAVEGSVTDSDIGTTLHGMLFSGVFYFNGTTDYLRVMVRQTSGGALDLGFGEFNPRLNVMWMSGLV